jgi:hypothetical protein
MSGRGLVLAVVGNVFRDFPGRDLSHEWHRRSRYLLLAPSVCKFAA